MFRGPSFIVSTMQEETTPIFKLLWYDWTQQQPGIEPINPLGQCWVSPIVAFYNQHGLLRTYSSSGSSISGWFLTATIEPLTGKSIKYKLNGIKIIFKFDKMHAYQWQLKTWNTRGKKSHREKLEIENVVFVQFWFSLIFQTTAWCGLREQHKGLRLLPSHPDPPMQHASLFVCFVCGGSLTSG